MGGEKPEHCGGGGGKWPRLTQWWWGDERSGLGANVGEMGVRCGPGPEGRRMLARPLPWLLLHWAGPTTSPLPLHQASFHPRSGLLLLLPPPCQA